jgi:hypothetical protein
VVHKLSLGGLAPPPKTQLKEEIITRPSLSPADKRMDSLRVRLTMTERAKIEAKADQAGLTVSEYLRKAALSRKIEITQGRQLDFASTNELRRVGVLLNQIAKALNAKQEALPSSLVDATEKLDAIFDIVFADLSEDW